MKNGRISHWMEEIDPAPRASLPGDAEFDVVIVGAGLTGLWSAYYLTREAPQLRIAVLESQRVGYGASGRNGGWLSHLVPGNRVAMARRFGHERVVALQRAMVEGIDEVLALADELKLDIDQVRGGNLAVATSPAGMHRLAQRRETDLAFGLRDDEVQVLTAERVGEHIAAAHTVGGLFSPMVAAIDPAKLVTRLAEALEARGVTIFEDTHVDEVRGGSVRTPRGTVRAESVLICTEGYSGPLIGRRRVIPINSSMIVTRPLDADAWRQIGWDARECLSDSAHIFMYAQRTADGRIAIGGRGMPYRFASGTGGDGRIPQRTIDGLAGRLRRYFPAVPMQIEHAWSGVLGVTRDWSASVTFDPSSRIGAAFGYAGHGVTATNVAARTLVDRLLGLETAHSRLLWADNRPRNWEPEPIRWVGVHAMYTLFGMADRIEEANPSDRTALLARIGGRLGGLE